jgi:hypothetical protein
MRAATMVQKPPTPPNGSAELQYGLHHLVQHNAGRSLQYDGGDAQYLSRQGSHFNSPAPMFHDISSQNSIDHFSNQHFDVGGYPEPHGHDMGLGIHYVSSMVAD